MDDAKAEVLDESPELVVQAAYLAQFQKLRRWILYLAAALVIALGLGGWALWKTVTDRSDSHRDTEQQITQLACGVVNQIPPDHGLADQVRERYRCGPYGPPKAKVQPKPGTVPGER